MRSTEFLREEGAGNDQPMSDAAYAAQRAQGEKNLNAVKGFFGGKPAAAAPAAAPAAAKPAPPGTSIDPIVRQRLGYGPATQKEIADYQAANPNYGKLVSSDGRPVQSGTPGVTVAAGGEQAVTKAAQTAAPFSRGDAHAGQGGTNYQEPAPVATPAAPAAPPPGGIVDPNAGELGNRDPSLDTIRKNAGLVGTQNQAPDAAAQAGQIADRMDAEAGANTAGTEVPAALPTGTIDPNAGELGNQTPSTRIPPAPAAPTAAKVAPGVRPAIVGYASSMGLYKNGRPDTAAIKAFQQKNGLKADGIIGPDTSGAILSAAKPSDAGSGRGGQSGPTSPQKLYDPNPYGPNPITQAATPAPVDPTKQSVSQRMATQPSPVNQFRAKVGLPAGGTSPAARPVRESKFDESVNQMRRWSIMLKG